MKNKNSIFNKILNSSLKQGWKLRNLGCGLAANPSVLEDLYKMQVLRTDEVFSDHYANYGFEFNEANKDELSDLYRKHGIENPSDEVVFTSFEKSWKPLDLLIQETGDEENYVAENCKIKLHTILSYYPEYKWLKKNYVDVKGGVTRFNELAEVMQEEFKKTKIQGRFRWNIL